MKRLILFLLLSSYLFANSNTTHTVLVHDVIISNKTYHVEAEVIFHGMMDATIRINKLEIKKEHRILYSITLAAYKNETNVERTFSRIGTELIFSMECVEGMSTSDIYLLEQEVGRDIIDLINKKD